MQEMSKVTKNPSIEGKVKSDGSYEFDLLKHIEWRHILTLNEDVKVNICINMQVNDCKQKSIYQEVTKQEIRSCLAKKIQKQTESLLRGSLNFVQNFELYEMKEWLEMPIRAEIRRKVVIQKALEETYEKTVQAMKAFMEKFPSKQTSIDTLVSVPIHDVISQQNYKVENHVALLKSKNILFFAVSIILKSVHEKIVRQSNVIRSQMNRHNSQSFDLENPTGEIFKEDLFHSEFIFELKENENLS